MTWNERVWKIVTGAAIAAAGAVFPVLLQLAGTVDDGTAQGALAAAVLAVLANAIRQFVRK